MNPLSSADVKGKYVLVRVDFNVPMDGKTITDDTRIRESLPTIRYLQERGARIILCSHLGRPQGKDERYSLLPIAQHLERLLSRKIFFLNEVKSITLNDGEIAMLENIRFHKEEEQNDYNFAQHLASIAEIYVNDAFGTAHRAHASTEGVAHFLPSYAGFLLEKEVKMLNLANERKHPYVLIIGGAKVKDKLGILERLAPLADVILVGGGIANSMLAAKGLEIGNSLHEKYAGPMEKIILPKDVLIIRNGTYTTVPGNHIPSDATIIDIGPQTLEEYAKHIAGAALIVWNGPMGKFEDPHATATARIAQHIAASKAISIVGGGETASAAKNLTFTHVSTGGGASLEFLEGKVLPGIAALDGKRE